MQQTMDEQTLKEMSNINHEGIDYHQYPIKDYSMKYNEEELDSPEVLEKIEKAIKSDIDLNAIPYLNRAQRRALAKSAGKSGRACAETISETAKKLTYINLIQRLIELNKKKEQEENNEQAIN